MKPLINKSSTKLLFLFGYIFSIGIFLGSALGISRPYQDSWILENLFFQFSSLVIFFFLYVSLEKRNEHVALATGVFIFVIRLSVAFKYEYLYGTHLDQSFHLANLSALLRTGSLEPNNIYSDTPGLYLLFTSLKPFFTDSTADDLIRFAPAFLFFLFPLSMLIFSKLLSLPPTMIKFVILGCVLSLDPYFFTLQGGTIGAVFFQLVFLASILRSSWNGTPRLLCSIFTMIGLFNLVILHSITSLIAISMILFVGMIAILVKKIPTRYSVHPEPHSSYLILSSGVFGLVFLAVWWMYRAKGVFSTITIKLAEIINDFGLPIRPPIPDRFFGLSWLDRMTVVFLYHADIMVFVGLSLLGIFFVFLLFRRKHTLKSYQFLLSISILTLLVIILGLFVFKIGQIEYLRFFGYIAIFAPILIGLGFYRLKIVLRYRLGSIPGFILTQYFFLLALCITFIQVFPYQPAIPAVKLSSQSDPAEDYVVYLHTVNSLYQQSMIDFAHQNVPLNTRVSADTVTFNIARGQWGINYSSLMDFGKIQLTVPLDQGKWRILLIHNPGFAGPLFETVEYRSFFPPAQMLPSQKFNIVYNNGGSFIFTR